MGKIKLNKIRTYSYHGCLIEEGKIGSDYNIDLEIDTDLKLSAASDNLKDTVDYVLLNRIVVQEMTVRSHLLENVAKRIADRVLSEFETISKVKVSLSKLNPPIGGDVKKVTIELEEERCFKH